MVSSVKEMVDITMLAIVRFGDLWVNKVSVKVSIVSIKIYYFLDKLGSKSQCYTLFMYYSEFVIILKEFFLLILQSQVDLMATERTL